MKISGVLAAKLIGEELVRKKRDGGSEERMRLGAVTIEDHHVNIRHGVRDSADC